MKFPATGVTGSIGNRLINRLIEIRFRVKALVRHTKAEHGFDHQQFTIFGRSFFDNQRMKWSLRVVALFFIWQHFLNLAERKKESIRNSCTTPPVDSPFGWPGVKNKEFKSNHISGTMFLWKQEIFHI